MTNKFKIEDVRNFWDKVAPIYNFLNKGVGYVHTQRFEKALRFSKIESGQKILNVWSRTGNLIPYLRKTNNLEVSNMEASSEMMKISQEKYPQEKFELTDLENFSKIQNDYFDRIISLETLEHVPRPSIFLKELHRILKPNGLLIMSLPP
jgi:ubiquinone/menaquinone biosynthesis C-methylase UbiE